MKKKLALIVTLFTTALFLMACSDDNQDASSNKIDRSLENVSVSQSERDSDAKETNETDKREDESKSISESDESEYVDSGKTHSQEHSENTNDQSEKESGPLSEYSSKEVEYARVWLQIAGNRDVEELNIQYISAGEQVNPYDDDSINYSEDIIELSGKIMADGVITYSGNGDDTINLYDIPSHWPSYKQIDESMEKYTEDIIENTKQVYIEPRDDEEIIKLIEKINVQG